MLVVLTDKQVISAEQICQGCLLADRSGLPRWRQGQLYCGRLLNIGQIQQANIYECQMGFKVANIE